MKYVLERKGENVIDAARLSGCWHLVAFREHHPENGWVDALGPGARGVINYWPSGQMSVLIVGARRPRFSGAWVGIPAEDKAAALDGMVAYSGAYAIDGERVVHRVENCWIPNWEGRELVREVALKGNELTLATVAELSRGPGQQVVWRRAAT